MFAMYGIFSMCEYLPDPLSCSHFMSCYVINLSFVLVTPIPAMSGGESLTTGTKKDAQMWI